MTAFKKKVCAGRYLQAGRDPEQGTIITAS